MPIRFACPHCEKTLKVDDRFAGRRAKCPNCRESVEIPERTSTEAPVPVRDDRATDSSDSERAAEATATRGAANSEISRNRALNGEIALGEEAPPVSHDQGQWESTEVGSPMSATATTTDASLAAPPPFEKLAADAAGPVPAAPPPNTPRSDEESDQYASPFEVFDDDAEIVYAEGYGREEPERFLVSRTRLAIPRAYVYLQGALLVAIAVLSFALGWAFGGSGSYRTDEAPQGPVTLTGIVEVDGYDGPIAASEGALVAILPSGRRPAEKIPVDGLRPNEIGRIVPPRTLSAIREMGGALAVSDARGEFRAELPTPGEYHVLVVLPDVYRPTTSQIALADLARLGDYFLLPDQLIGDCRYSLQTERIRETERIDVRFP